MNTTGRKFITLWIAALLLAALAGGAAGEDEPIALQALRGGGMVARAIAQPNPMKPYVNELFSPSGVQVLLDSPHDHVHHHGLMFAIGAGETDFWAEQPAEKYGRQVPRGKMWTYPKEGKSSILHQTLDWVAPGGKPQLVENRQIATVAPGAMDWVSTLTPAKGAGDVKLFGSHYFGLGLRLTPDLNDKVRFIFPPGTPAGRVVRGDERLTSATWCAAAGEIGGKPVTVVMWDDPENPRHPAVWFTMAKPFAYLSATLDLDARPMALPAREKLKLHYGVAVLDGIADAARIEQEYQKWLKAPFKFEDTARHPAP